MRRRNGSFSHWVSAVSIFNNSSWNERSPPFPWDYTLPFQNFFLPQPQEPPSAFWATLQPSMPTLICSTLDSLYLPILIGKNDQKSGRKVKEPGKTSHKFTDKIGDSLQEFQLPRPQTPIQSGWGLGTHNMRTLQVFPAVGSTPLKWTTSYSSETSVCVPFWFLEHSGWSLLLHNLYCAQWIPWDWLMNALVYGSDFIHWNILIGTDIITFWRMSQGSSIHAGPLKVNLVDFSVSKIE